MANLIGTSPDKNVPGVSGENDEGSGVRGISKSGTGVLGTSESGVGAWGGSTSSSGVGGLSGSGYGVHGVSNSNHGVHGDSEKGTGVYGRSTAPANLGHAGVTGEAFEAVGVFGRSQSSTGVGGLSSAGIGVHGVSNPGPGVRGDSEGGIGIHGVAKTGVGVYGISDTGEGIHGHTNSPTVAAIAGFNVNPSGTGAAIYGEKQGNAGHAGFFRGNVHVTGNLTADGDIVLTNADCAEDFDISDTGLIEPGTVMVLGEEGVLRESHQAYDKRVAGVISGAGDYKPGIVLDKQQSRSNRKPIALLGKVYCKVDANYASIEVGDLLTTSDTPGHAMKADDQMKAFGTVIGKALRPLKEGQGLIPILIALQ